MTAPTLPICERLDAWAKVSFSQDRARDLRKAKGTIERLSAALVELQKHCHSETRQGLLSIIDAALGKDASDVRAREEDRG
jgi:hypothetical protein